MHFGALLFLRIIANIYVITLSYEFGYTALTTGTMLLATVGLLVWDWNSLRIVFNQPAIVLPTSAFFKRKLWERVGVVIFLFTATYRALTDHYNLMLWLGVCVSGSPKRLGIALPPKRHRLASTT